MPNTLKILLISTMIVLSFDIASSQASVVIDGISYPDGCYKDATIIKCPLGALNAGIEYAKRIDPPTLLGHSSNGTVASQPAFQRPIQCNAAVSRLNDKLADTQYWFRRAIYRTRELTAEAGTVVRDYIRIYSIRAMSYGKSIYANGRRGEDADGLCREYVDKAYDEVARLFTLVRAEAAAGNRDLKNTGLNRNASPYNN